MNQMTLNDAMDEAARRLSPDVDGIVDRAVSGGRRQVRRRRGGTLVASLAVVAAVAAGGGWWLQRPGGGGSSATDSTVVAATPTAGPASTSNSPMPGVRKRATGDVIRDELAAMLPDGRITDVEVREDDATHDWTGSQRGIEVNLRLDGTPVRLQLMDWNRDPDKVREEWAKDPGPRPDGCTATDARSAIKNLDARGDSDRTRAKLDCVTWLSQAEQRECALAPTCTELDRYVTYSAEKQVCGYNADAYPCRQLPNGSWLAAGSGRDDNDEGPGPWVMANLFADDGWYVYVLSENEPTSVLTVDQATEIVTSDAWFE